jgi:hypothetical protein
MVKLLPLCERDDHGCLLWCGLKDHAGYGRFKFGGRSLRAHRVAWSVDNGSIPDGLCVLHKCDNPACVNVDHLFLGTDKDNAADRAAKGRNAIPRNKLPIAQVTEIFLDSRPLAEVGKTHGISRRAVSQIKNGHTWKNVTAVFRQPPDAYFASAAQPKDKPDV